MGVGRIYDVILPDEEHKRPPAGLVQYRRIAFVMAAFPGVSQIGGKPEDELHRCERIQAQRNYAKPHGDAGQPRLIWPHRLPRARRIVPGNQLSVKTTRRVVHHALLLCAAVAL